MAEEQPGASDKTPENDTGYSAPKIEEVISREGLEREVAYAGIIGPSQAIN